MWKEKDPEIAQKNLKNSNNDNDDDDDEGGPVLPDLIIQTVVKA